MFENEFLTKQSAGDYKKAISEAVAAVLDGLPQQPYAGSSPTDLSALWGDEAALGDVSIDEKQVWRGLRQIVAHSIALTNPATIAHLQPPPLILSLAADVVIAALNQSLDSFDQGPAATMIELRMSRWLCKELGFPSNGGAVFTSGGTQSNFMGLLLARDAMAAERWNWPVQLKGLPPDASKMRFLCSEVAHFTVEKSAYQLGLGRESVIKIPVDSAFRMNTHALAKELARMKQNNLVPVAIVATAGTTDFGSIDPLPEIAQIAHAAGAWLHVDAAYGSALLLSTKHRDALRGLEFADSVSVDFHKKFWQSISCAAFAIRDAANFRHLEMHADYLNPESHDAMGIPDLVSRSIATTRRFDALKLWFSLQLLGRATFAAMIDRTLALAQYAAAQIRQASCFELFNEPQLGCVVFRYLAQTPTVANDSTQNNSLNKKIRDRLFESGEAVLGHTRVRGSQCLKFTCMNPMTKEGDLDALLERIRLEGKKLEAELTAASC